MPLAPQYTWEETESALNITVRAPGLGKGKTDLLISDVCLRVSCQPYFLQLDLHHEVDEAQSSAVFGPSQLSIRLNKVRPSKPLLIRTCSTASPLYTYVYRSSQPYGTSWLQKAAK